MKEIWKDVKNYEGLYQVSNLGNIKSSKREGSAGGFIKSLLTNGYYSVNLWKSGKAKMKRIHRLVCEAFIENTDNKPQINHINGNKLNNRIDNLEWATQSENMKHAYKIGLTKSPMIGRVGKLNGKSKAINQYNLSGCFIKIYESIEIAAKETNCSVSGISLCANGKLKKSGGFIWKF